MEKINKLPIKKGTIKYKDPNIALVPREEVHSSNECRLYSEIFMGIGLTLIGVIISKFNLTLLVSGIISLGLATFFMIRYILKDKKLNNF
ncbi:MAG: hypothetical protein WC812_04180 [Candidatus Pacearchaeota archaeon]|jgi:hypothetical protein